MLIVLFSFTTSASFGASAEKETGAKDISKVNFEKVYIELTGLLKEFYPRAMVTKTDSKIHFEYKVHKYATISGREEMAPTLDGILGDLEVTSGKYKGKKILPLTTNETLFVILDMAPYLEESDCHLLCKLLYPHTVPNTFLIKFKELVKDFDRNSLPSRLGPGGSQSFGNGESTDQADTADKATGKTTETTELSDTTDTTESPLAADTPEDSESAQEAPLESEVAKGESDKAHATDKEIELEDPSKETDLAAALMNPSPSSSKDHVEAPDSSEKQKEEKFDQTVADSGVLDGGETDDIFAMAAKAEKTAKKEDSKARVKPTKKYFNSWFALYYQSVYKAIDAGAILMTFYSQRFRQGVIENYHKLSPAARKQLLKNLKESTYMTEWRIDRLQPGPGGCTDIFVYGRVAGRFPSYLIHRMVWEQGTWRIDSGRGRFWYNR